MSFEDFISKSKETIEALNKGESDFLNKQEFKTIKNEKELAEEVKSIDYISQFNHFVNNADNFFIGKMLDFDYKSTQILTQDKFLLNQNGVPRGSFLIATLRSFEKLKGIEHFLLLFVNNFTRLEDSKENILNLIGQEKKTNFKTVSNAYNYMGLDCKIMGMFYNDNGIFNFSSQVNLVLSPNNYHVLKPNRELKNIITNFKTIKEIISKEQKQNVYKIGRMIETEAEIFTDQSSYPEVMFDLDLLKGRRTAFFGKTRLGKSNIVKILISKIIENNNRKTNTDIRDKIGLVVFDENGEYANTNTQDGTSIYDRYQSTGLVKRYTIDRKKDKNLMLNFYLNPVETMSLFSYWLNKEGRSIYLDNFLNTDFVSLPEIQKYYEQNNGKAVEISESFLFKSQLFWSILNKVGFKYKTSSGNSYFFEEIAKKVKNPFIVSDNFIRDLENDEENKDFINKNKPKKGDNDELLFEKMCNIIDLLAEMKVQKPDILLSSDKRKYLQYDSLLEMFNTTNKAGYKVLRKFTDFHSEKSNNSVEELVNSVSDSYITAIIDLSTTTNAEVKRYYAQRIVTNLYNRAVVNFVNNETNKKPNISFHFEEAHNLFPSDSSKGIYFKLAKEGAKYNVGMLYATQSPSNIYSELLTQTENFFIGHLSSPKEVSALTSLSYDFTHLGNDILSVKKVGYVKMLTENHRYPISVQIEKFT